MCKEKMTERLMLRMTPTMREGIKDAAKAKSINETEWIRGQLAKGIEGGFDEAIEAAKVELIAAIKAYYANMEGVK